MNRTAASTQYAQTIDIQKKSLLPLYNNYWADKEELYIISMPNFYLFPRININFVVPFKTVQFLCEFKRKKNVYTHMRKRRFPPSFRSDFAALYVLIIYTQRAIRRWLLGS